MLVGIIKLLNILCDPICDLLQSCDIYNIQCN